MRKILKVLTLVSFLVLCMTQTAFADDEKTVDFLNGENVFYTTTVISGNAVNNPTKYDGTNTVNYPNGGSTKTFKYWELDGVEYDFSTPVNKSISLNAAFATNGTAVTITYNTGSTEVIPSVNTTVGAQVTLPTPAARDGYTFKGWYNGSELWDPARAVYGNIALSAQWATIDPNTTYTVTFQTYGGTPVPDTQYVTYKNTVTYPKEPQRSGYIFEAWTLDGEVFDFSTPITKDITLEADWLDTNATYTVTFNTDGGTPAIASKTVKYGKKVSKPSKTPKKKGNAFQYWTYQGTEWDFGSDAVYDDIELVASWSSQSDSNAYYYTVKYETKGKNSDDYDDEIVKDGAYLDEPDEPERKGYVFQGWYKGNSKWDFDEDKVKDNMTLEAKWKSDEEVKKEEAAKNATTSQNNVAAPTPQTTSQNIATPINPLAPGSGNGSNGSGGSSGSDSGSFSAPKTADESQVPMYFAIMILAVILSSVVARRFHANINEG